MHPNVLPQILCRVWRHINMRRRMQFGLLFLLMVLTSFAEVISIGAVLPFLGVLTAPERIFDHAAAQPLIQVLNLTESEQLLLPLTIIFAAAVLVAGLMRIILLFGQTRLSYSIGADLSYDIYYRTLYQPYAVHVARNSSAVISGISQKANTVVGSVISPVITILSSILMLVSILGVLLSIDKMVAVFAFVGFGLIYVIVIFATKKSVARDSLRINHESTQVIKALQEGLGGIRDVLIDGTQAVYCNEYRNSDIPLRRALANLSILKGLPRFGIEALGMLLIAVLAYTLAISSSGITNSIPVLGALALGAQRLLPLLQQAYSSWIAIRGGQASVTEVLNLLDQPLPAYADAILTSTIPFKQSITLKNLAFKYTENSPWVLQSNLSVSISKGSRIGLIGATGSGKSTLLDIIMGLLEPVSGSLQIDGVDITEQNQRGWQKHISHVPQTIFLTDSSISENIAFGVPLEQIDHARVCQSAQKAQISQTIESWSKQYNTPVGERGVRLSGGQRQRIGIARALYKQTDVLIFDEATSALDNDTERAVMEAVEDLDDKLTVIIVAHRLTTLKNCTQVIEIEDGKIKRMGTYAEIVDQPI